jgi:uncharacterized protein YebE (UPF0316 family)
MPPQLPLLLTAANDPGVAAAASMAWFIPILIFFARILDVSIGTVRMILVINGHRLAAAGLGFVEVIIWALAIGGVIKFLDNPVALVAYGAGFAAGTLVGMILEEQLALGYRMVHVFNRDPSYSVSWKLRERGYRVTTIPGEGLAGPVELATVAVKRKSLKKLLDELAEQSPRAFVTVERADRATTAADLHGRNRTSGTILKRLAAGQVRK